MTAVQLYSEKNKWVRKKKKAYCLKRNVAVKTCAEKDKEINVIKERDHALHGSNRGCSQASY